MTYTDFVFYQETYQGTMGEADFDRLAPRASAYLDMLTAGKIGTELTEAVQLACCAVVDELLLQEQGGEIASVNNDGYSVNYVAGVSRARSPARRKYDAAMLYLANTGLVYAGV